MGGIAKTDFGHNNKTGIIRLEASWVKRTKPSVNKSKVSFSTGTRNRGRTVGKGNFTFVPNNTIRKRAIVAFHGATMRAGKGQGCSCQFPPVMKTGAIVESTVSEVKRWCRK